MMNQVFCFQYPVLLAPAPPGQLGHVAGMIHRLFNPALQEAGLKADR
jgi:hypothetical protein